MKKSLFVIMALLCLVLTCCNDDDIGPDDPETDLDILALTDDLMTLYDEASLPGFAVTVVKEDKVVYQKAFGQSDVYFDKAYTNETTQPIASLSKTFIGLALMKAIEQNHFTLDTEINEVLPFSIVNPHTPEIPILIKHLVTHSAGFEDSDEAYTANYHILTGEDLTTPTAQLILSYGNEVNDGMPLGDYMKEVFAPEGIFYDADNFEVKGPGSTYEYSNIGASLAAYLIEVKSGKSYADFVKEYIFDPLGLDDAAFVLRDLDLAEMATLYVSKEHPIPAYSHFSYPDGFVNISNKSMGTFLLEMIRGYDGKGTLLSDENYKTLFTRQSPTDLIDGETHGVFWDLVEGRIEHSGSDPGVVTFLSFDPEAQSGYYLATNINGNELGEGLGVDGSLAFQQLLKALDFIKEFERK